MPLGPISIRRYETRDREGCLAAFRSNVPEYFIASDEDEVQRFLDNIPGIYFVVEADDASILACGGIAEETDPSVATLCWGIVDASVQRIGIGTRLLQHRIAEFLSKHPSVKRVRVNTTQKVQGFYERHGFRVLEVRAGAYGPDLDHVRMQRELRLV